ncbi:F-box protein SKIP23, partial [Bienertia sinuspersici]
MTHFSRHRWSKLPRKIIYIISKSLKTRQQIIQFKRVCKRWNKHSVLLPLNTLSLTLPLTIPISSSCGNTLPFIRSSTHSLHLEVSSIYLITPLDASLRPWMVMVREPNPGKLQLRHPLTAKRVTKLLPTLDMSKFRAFELARGYNFKKSDSVLKVILLSSSTPSSSLELLVLFRQGVLGKLTVRMSDHHHGWKILKPHRKYPFWFRYLDDITVFKEKYCCLDRRGKLYELNIESMKMVNLLVSEPIYGREAPMIVQRRKRLVVDPTSKELHSLVREPKNGNVRFKLYKFNECCKKWDVVEHLGKDRVLFGVDHCFFAKAKYFPGCKGNCIVFAANCFTQYRGRNTPDRRLFGDDDDVEVGVYRIGKGDNFRLLSSVYGEFSKSIWPPPIWLSPKSQEDLDEENFSTIKCHSDDHVEPMLIDSSDEGFTDKDKDEEIKLNSSSSKPYKVSDSNGITNSDKTRQRSSFNEQTYNSEEHVSAPPLPIEYKVHNVGTSKMDCQKTGVCSDYNKAMRAYALESVAKLVITLQNTTGKSLSVDQADDIRATMSDLQRVGLKVDWLVPAVEK